MAINFEREMLESHANLLKTCIIA